MFDKVKSLPKNPKVQKTALILAGAAAAYYGGPVARDKVYEYLPVVAHWFGL